MIAAHAIAAGADDAVIFAAGAAYARCLWSIAVRIAHQRSLPLGDVPGWALPLCGCCAVAVGLCFPTGIALMVGATLIGAIVCGLVDARTGFIFDALSLTMAAVSGLFAILEGRFTQCALAAVVVGGGLAVIYLLTARRGIGLGDVKLSSAIALGYGPQAAIIAVGSAFVLGALYAGVLIGCGRAGRSDTLRFGPFIAGGAAVGLTASGLGWHW
jgi:leader peptidase (prepilin peptidase)/N-methyltransferase